MDECVLSKDKHQHHYYGDEFVMSERFDPAKFLAGPRRTKQSNSPLTKSISRVHTNPNESAHED